MDNDNVTSIEIRHHILCCRATMGKRPTNFPGASYALNFGERLTR